MDVTFSHVGICVSDLERSVRFYCEGLGFELVQSHTVGQEFGRLMEIDDVVLCSRASSAVTASRSSCCTSTRPGTPGEPVRRPMNQLGLTHLSLRVGDLDAVAARHRVARAAPCVRGTRTTFGSSDALDFVYCTDPDGVRIELMHLPGSTTWSPS